MSFNTPRACSLCVVIKCLLRNFISCPNVTSNHSQISVLTFRTPNEIEPIDSKMRKDEQKIGLLL